MANAKYPKYLEALLTGTALDVTDGNLKAQCVDLADYTYSAAHEFLDDVPAGARVGSAVALTTPTGTDGKFNADNVTIPSVTGDQFEAVVFFYDTGVEATSRLVGFWDQGIDITPDGNNVLITVPTDIFSL